MPIHDTEQGRRYLTERKTRKIDLIFDRFFWHPDMRYAIRGQISIRGLEHLSNKFPCAVGAGKPSV